MPVVPETVLCRYYYDPLDRLTGTELQGQAKCQHFYQKNRLTTEIQDQRQLTIFQHDSQLLAQHQLENGVSASTLLVMDLQRSVLHTLSATARQPLVYSPYGHQPLEGEGLSLLGYSGERPDPMTGHYLLGNGYRAFNPVLMRFNRPDSMSPFGEGGFNPYTYCRGDPINQSDPTGHVPLLSTLVKAIVRFKQLGRASRAAVAMPLATSTPAARSTLFTSPSFIMLGEAKITTDFVDKVVAHGAPFLTQTTGLVSGGKLASQLKELWGPAGENKLLRLVSCYSANGGEYASQAQRVANKLQRPVIGYYGKVTDAGNSGQLNHRHFFPQSGSVALRTRFLNNALSPLMKLTVYTARPRLFFENVIRR